MNGSKIKRQAHDDKENNANVQMAPRLMCRVDEIYFQAKPSFV